MTSPRLGADTCSFIPESITQLVIHLSRIGLLFILGDYNRMMFLSRKNGKSETRTSRGVFENLMIWGSTPILYGIIANYFKINLIIPIGDLGRGVIIVQIDISASTCYFRIKFRGV